MKWFIIREKEHLGPFDEIGLKQLLISGEISENTPVWREGMPDPDTYKNVFLAKEEATPEIDDELPPALPPEALLPKKRTEEKASVPDSEVPEFNPEFTIEDIPLPEEEELFINQAVMDVIELEDAPLQKELYEEPKTSNENFGDKSQSNIEKTKTKKLKPVLILLILLLCLASAVGAWVFYTVNVKTFARPSKMSVQDYDRLVQNASITSINSENLTFEFALSKDKSTVWMSVNSLLEGRVELALESIDGKTLSTEPILAKAKGMLKEKIARFDTLNFEQGQRLIDGHYKVQVRSGGKLSLPLELKVLVDNKRYLKSIVPKDTLANWLPANSYEISYQGEALLSALRVSQFNRALNDFNKKSNSNAKVFWEELEQKYQTVKAIALKIEEAIDEVFGKGAQDWILNVGEFERSYTSNFGNFFTNFIIQNEKSYKEIEEKTFDDKVEVISSYTRLSRLAKDLGAQTMAALQEMKELKDPLDSQQRSALQDKISLNFKEYFQEIDEKIAQLEAR